MNVECSCVAGCRDGARMRKAGMVLALEAMRISRALGTRRTYSVMWLPGRRRRVGRQRKRIYGEIRDDVIFLYHSDPQKALDTLRQEMVDQLIRTRIVEPYNRLVSSLMEVLEERHDELRKDVVEGLCRAMEEPLLAIEGASGRGARA